MFAFKYEDSIDFELCVVEDKYHMTAIHKGNRYVSSLQEIGLSLEQFIQLHEAAGYNFVFQDGDNTLILKYEVSYTNFYLEFVLHKESKDLEYRIKRLEKENMILHQELNDIKGKLGFRHKPVNTFIEFWSNENGLYLKGPREVTSYFLSLMNYFTMNVGLFYFKEPFEKELQNVNSHLEYGVYYNILRAMDLVLICFQDTNWFSIEDRDKILPYSHKPIYGANRHALDIFIKYLPKYKFFSSEKEMTSYMKDHQYYTGHSKDGGVWHTKVKDGFLLLNID